MDSLATSFLQDFFKSPYGKFFCLTGGFALSSYYLCHRLTSDIDFLVVDGDFTFKEFREYILLLSKKLGFRICSEKLTDAFLNEKFQGLELILEKKKLLKVDFNNDFSPHYGRLIKHGRIVVDSLENIAVNKVRALTGRTDYKDFIDLFVILNSTPFEIADLAYKANRKDEILSKSDFIRGLLAIKSIQGEYLYEQVVSKELLEDFFARLALALSSRNTSL